MTCGETPKLSSVSLGAPFRNRPFLPIRQVTNNWNRGRFMSRKSRRNVGICVWVVVAFVMTACSSENPTNAPGSTPTNLEASSSSAAPSQETTTGSTKPTEAISTIDYWDQHLILPGRGDKGSNEETNEALYEQMNAGERSSLDKSEQARLKSLAKQVLIASVTGEGRDKFPELWEKGSVPDGPALESVTILASSAEVHRVAGEPYREVFIVFEGSGEGRTSPPRPRTFCFKPGGVDWRPVNCWEIPTQ
jgi:hypothetical protein